MEAPKPKADRGRKQAEMIQDYHRTFTSEPGKKVLQDLFKRFGFKQTTATADPHQTYFNEGQRATILFIVSMLGINSNQLLERIQELNKSTEE